MRSNATTGAEGEDRYRTYRAALMSEVDRSSGRNTWGQDADNEVKEHPFRHLRHQVEAAREQLYYRYCDSWRGLSEEPGPLARRALAIPPDQRLAYPLVVRVLFALLGPFTPARIAIWIARRQLRHVRSYQGRQLVFAAVVSRWFTLRREHYCPSIDFIVRNAEGPVSHDCLQRLVHKNPSWLRAYYKVGERSMQRLARRLARPLESDDGPLVELLVDEGVIRTPEGLAAWPWRPTHLQGLDRHGGTSLLQARIIVTQLVRLGVSPEAIIRACQGGSPDFNAHQLQENLSLLQAHQIELRPLAEAVGKLLWTASAHRWRFLLERLKLNSAGKLELFVDLLDTHAEPNARLADALIENGTEPQGLAACQAVLTLDVRDAAAPAHAFRRLAMPPFSFTAADFGHVRGYARDHTDLDTFLDVLVRHGLVAPADVLAFERCYQALSARSISPLLDIAMPRRGQATAADLADWVYRAGRLGHVDACADGAELLGLDNLQDLQRLLAVVPVGASVIRYLILDKELTTLKSLLHWFHKRAAGVLEVKLWAPLGEFERLALDDAFQRCCFTRVNHNVSCMYGAARSRADALLGVRPSDVAKTELVAYHEARKHIIETQRIPVLRDAARIMSITSGVLFASLLDVAEPAEATARLASVAPVLEELLAGRGPTGPQPTAVEAEAIALVFETTPDHVQELWSHLTGREHDLASLVLKDHYPMCWRQARWRMRDGAQLETQSLMAIARVPALASHARAYWSRDMHEACRGLRPSQFISPAADVHGLAHHLAMLCAIAQGDELVDDALQRWDQQIRENLLVGSVEYGELEHLQTFIDTTLPDALADRAPQRIGSVSEDFARKLEERLGARVPDDVDNPTRRAQAAVAATLVKLQETFRRWLARERAKFEPEQAGQASTVLRAVATKTPAAFFARQAVALCTRYNVDMWKEQRHSHLVVFDSAQRCMAGMAMLFVEVVPAIDPDRPSLVIRALNPVSRYAAEHDVAGIVDAFFATAMSVAADNDLAAVAIPGNQGMVSNVPDVQRDVFKRYVGKARQRFGQKSMRPEHGGQLHPPLRVDAPFEGYHRGGGGSVASLYVIWWRGTERPGADAGHPQRQEASWTTA